MATALTKNANGSQTVAGLASGETSDHLPLTRSGSILAIGVTGTFNSGTVTIQGTIDGTTWFDMLDGVGGDAIAFTADGYVEASTALRAVRAVADGSITSVDVAFSVFGG